MVLVLISAHFQEVGWSPVLGICLLQLFSTTLIMTRKREAEWPGGQVARMTQEDLDLATAAGQTIVMSQVSQAG